MAKFWGPTTTPRNTNVPPVGSMDGSLQGGHVRVYRETIDLAKIAQSNNNNPLAIGDQVVVGYASKGESFLFGVISASASFGATATIAIGSAAATGKYRAAAIFTTADVPTLFGGTTAGLSTLGKLAADEEILLTVGAAASPTTGFVQVDLYFAQS